MSFTAFSVAYIIIFITAAGIEIFRGTKRGFLKTAFSLSSVLLSIVLSIITVALSSEFVAETIDRFFRISSGGGIPTNALRAMIAMISGPFLFLVLFFLFRGVLAIVSRFICGSVFTVEEGDTEFEGEYAPAYRRNGRLWGGITGFICGFLITVTVVSPIMGTFEVADNLIETVKNADAEALSKIGIKDGDIDKYAKDPIGHVFYQLGGKFIYYASSSVDFAGHRSNPIRETEALRSIISDLVYLMPVVEDPRGATEEQLRKIDLLADNIKDLTVTNALIANSFSSGMRNWMNGYEFFGAVRPSFNDMIDPAIDNILQVCADSNYYSVADNIGSLLRSYAIIVRSGVLDVMNDQKAFLEFIADSSMISELREELAKNPNMLFAADAMSSVAMRAMVKEIYSPEISLTARNNIARGIADGLAAVNRKNYATRGEKVSAVKHYAEKQIKDYNLGVPENVIKLASEILLDEAEWYGDVTAEDVLNIFAFYSK